MTSTMTPPKKGWMDPSVEFRKGTFCYPATPKAQEELGLPNPRKWELSEKDWKLPPDWKEIILKGMKDYLSRYRSARLFLDICVRCGACADKCHYFIGSGDPKNMPVLRAELLRSVYRRYFTLSGKIFGRLAGARELTEDVLKEWFYYFYQCSECRRCSVFCPLRDRYVRNHHDGAGSFSTWWDAISTGSLNLPQTAIVSGNHLGIPPHAIQLDPRIRRG